MDDLISRLSELRSQYNLFDENEQGAYHTLTEAIAVLNEVNESAQPTQTNTPNTLEALDCISRQKAVDAFDCTDELIVGGSANAQNVMNYINKVIGKIKALPSAQPEIIRCKDCNWFGKAGCAVEIVDDSDKPTEDDFCSFAERRTDEEHCRDTE